MRRSIPISGFALAAIALLGTSGCATFCDEYYDNGYDAGCAYDGGYYGGPANYFSSSFGFFYSDYDGYPHRNHGYRDNDRGRFDGGHFDGGYRGSVRNGDRHNVSNSPPSLRRELSHNSPPPQSLRSDSSSQNRTNGNSRSNSSQSNGSTPYRIARPDDNKPR